MPRPSIIVIDGKPHRWSDIQRLRKEQLAASFQAPQLALFDGLPDDRRPAHERSASDRYRQPGLFTLAGGIAIRRPLPIVPQTTVCAPAGPGSVTMPPQPREKAQNSCQNQRAIS